MTTEIPRDALLERSFAELTGSTEGQAVLLLQSDGAFIAGKGDLADFALQHLQQGDDVREFVPLLYQAEAIEEQTIAYVHLPAGIVADISIYRKCGKIILHLVDTGERHQALQQQQQKANELALLQREQAVTLTNLHQAHQQLQTQRDELDRLYSAQQNYLNSLSHEVRNPLQAMLATLDSAESLDVESSARLLRSTQQLLILVENLLVQGQSAESAVAEVGQSVNLTELVSDCVQLLLPSASGKGLTLECHIAAELHSARLLLDGYRVRQILFNLIGNAIRYTKSGGIQVSVEKNNDQLLLKVTDTGPGIEADEQAGIFNAYQRGRQENYVHGAGLGLTISRELAQAMGGDLLLESEPGKGSRFILKLPATLMEYSHQDSTDDGHSEHLAKIPGRALLVDDDIDWRAAVSVWLEEWGIQAAYCADLAGLKQAMDDNGAPDWLLLDRQLPDGYGESMIAEVMKKWPACSILMLSGEVIECPTVSVLQKPVSRRALHRAMSAER